MGFTFPGSIADNVYNEKKNTKNHLMRALAEAYDQSIVPNSWEHIQFLVRNGLHSKVLHIGDELTCNKDNTEIVWQIIGMDQDIPIDPQFNHSLTLMMKNQWDQTVQFDSKEAIFYFPNGLLTGTYYFTIGAQPWYAADINKSFMFTLEKDIPAKGQLVLEGTYNQTCANTNISSYNSSSSDIKIETVTIIGWDGETGSFLGTINDTAQTNINSIQRAFYGSNNYKESAIRQWLNSNEIAGNVWKPQTVFDRPPNWASNLKGFLNGLDADFLAIIKPALIKTARNITTDNGGYDITKDKFYLLSKPQIFGGETVTNIDEGNAYKYFSDYSDLNIAGTGNDSNRIKLKSDGSQLRYWLRSPRSDYDHSIYTVMSTGQLSGTTVMSAFGIAAACTIY